jgi:hypothetical protein
MVKLGRSECIHREQRAELETVSQMSVGSIPTSSAGKIEKLKN